LRFVLSSLDAVRSEHHQEHSERDKGEASQANDLVQELPVVFSRFILFIWLAEVVSDERAGRFLHALCYLEEQIIHKNENAQVCQLRLRAQLTCVCKQERESALY